MRADNAKREACSHSKIKKAQKMLQKVGEYQLDHRNLMYYFCGFLNEVVGYVQFITRKQRLCGQMDSARYLQGRDREFDSAGADC